MNIPGLDLDKIVENIVNLKHSDMLNRIEDKDERDAKRKELVDYYSTGDVVADIKRQMNNVSTGVELITEVITTLQSAVPAMPIPGTVPQVIVTGAASGVPNPAWGKLFSAAVKPGMLATCGLAQYVLNKVLDSCEQINFDPPGVVTGLQAQLDDVKNQISVL